MVSCSATLHCLSVTAHGGPPTKCAKGMRTSVLLHHFQFVVQRWKSEDLCIFCDNADSLYFNLISELLLQQMCALEIFLYRLIAGLGLLANTEYRSDSWYKFYTLYYRHTVFLDLIKKYFCDWTLNKCGREKTEKDQLVWMLPNC